MTEENSHFTIDEQPTEETLVIEDLPEDFDLEDNVHDQLPTVEEAKANLPHKPAGNSKKLYILGVALVAAVVLTVTVIVVGARGKNKSEPTELTGRSQQVMDFLFSNQVSTLPVLQNRNTPQHRAATFVADGDAYQMEITEETAARVIERYVLSVLYFNYNGPEWNFNLNFLSNRDHCEWWDDFESPSGKTLRQGVICNKDGFVKELNLSWNGLKGNNIPHEIGYLGHLETLHMYYNDLGGYFPDAVRHMPKLKGIGLMKTGLTGPLPDWIGEMTQLTTLGLGDNQLYGEVPDSIRHLKNLKLLGLDGNSGLNGNMERFYPLKSLEALYLENNAFTGQLAPSGKWPNIREIDVSNNVLDGPVPSSLLNHPSLVVLDANKNILDGTFPDDILQNDSLQYLALQHNLIHGSISDRVGFMTALRHVDVSFNLLTGTIPDTMIELTELRYLATSHNGFDAQKLLDVSKMTNLMDLSMKSSNLIGTIPDWIGELSNLQLLDLDGNSLSGSIPSWIGLIRGLDHLLLNRNKLTGTIPAQLGNMPQLELLLLDGNYFIGNADVICESKNSNPSYFVSDCYPGENGEKPEIECRCCTQCCTDGDASCNNKAWTSNIDPVWEYGYVRPMYSFSLENAPAKYSKEENADISNPLP